MIMQLQRKWRRLKWRLRWRVVKIQASLERMGADRIYFCPLFGVIVSFDASSGTNFFDSAKNCPFISDMPIVDANYLYRYVRPEFIRRIVFGQNFSDFEFQAFSSMPNLEELVFEGFVRVIGDFKFSYNEKLTTVHFKMGGSRILQFAFYGCTDLRNLKGEIPLHVRPLAFAQTSLPESNP